jgi:perosamine synthetase
MRDFIPVCEPSLQGNELEYVNEAVSSNWISSAGRFVGAFERAFAEYCGVRYAVAVCNGTVALHLMIVAAGIGEGDQVIIPDFTMASSAFSICYTRAMPVFIDAERSTWNINTKDIERKITSKTRAIMSVDIFGNPCDVPQIRRIAEKHGLLVLEDAAEAHGAEYGGVKTGKLADITCFSFFANKIITTGEGGMVVTDKEEFYDRLRYFRNVCFPLNAPRLYMHEDIGFNYRMSNLHAAVGLAQVEKADYYRNRRMANHRLYGDLLRETPGVLFQEDQPESLNVNWMNAIVVQAELFGKTRDQLVDFLKERGIETRLLFAGMHRQGALRKYGCDCSGAYPVTDWLTDNGLYLPSGSSLTENEIAFICRAIEEYRKA